MLGNGRREYPSIANGAACDGNCLRASLRIFVLVVVLHGAEELFGMIGLQRLNHHRTTI